MITWLKNLKLNLYDDRETKRLVEAGEYTFTKEPKAILDCGAHKGIATEYFAKKYPRIPIHAYEPNPKTYKILERRMRKYPNVSTFNKAISGHDGVVNFLITDRTTASQIRDDGGIEVPCISLQRAINRIGAPVSIKMDIEGAEFEALESYEGAVEIVGEVHPHKAHSTNEEFRRLLSKFKTVNVPNEGKCVFSAV